MAITCIIEGCGNRKEKQGERKKNLFHQLPADKTNRKQWLENIEIYSHACKFLKQANSYVCFDFNFTEGILWCLPNP